MTADLLVGRARELAGLEHRIAGAVAGSGHVVVEGDAGAGRPRWRLPPSGIVLPGPGHVLRFDHALTQEVA